MLSCRPSIVSRKLLLSRPILYISRQIKYNHPCHRNMVEVHPFHRKVADVANLILLVGIIQSIRRLHLLHVPEGSFHQRIRMREGLDQPTIPLLWTLLVVRQVMCHRVNQRLMTSRLPSRGSYP